MLLTMNYSNPFKFLKVTIQNVVSSFSRIQIMVTDEVTITTTLHSDIPTYVERFLTF